jgi:hypothetical protein
MKRSKPSTSASPAVGDFVVRPAYDGRCGARVHRKTGERFDDIEPNGKYCETDDGAKNLAALMNDAQKIARHFYRISSRSPYVGSEPKEWVKHLIVLAVAEAIDGPRPLVYTKEAREYAEQIAEWMKETHAPLSTSSSGK